MAEKSHVKLDKNANLMNPKLDGLKEKVQIFMAGLTLSAKV